MGPLLTQTWLPGLMSYAGLLLDLLAVPLLLYRPTRPWAYAAAIFHLSNVVIFGLGTFPWFPLLMTALFFEPDFPRRLPGAMGRWFWHHVPAPTAALGIAASSRAGQLVVAARLAAYAVVQLALPLRYFLYPGPTHWTEEGHILAWHMMLRNKKSTASFRVRFAADNHEEIADLTTVVTPQQRRFADNPDCLLQVAHWLAADYQAQGRPLRAVFVDSRVELNGRPAQPLIAPPSIYCAIVLTPRYLAGARAPVT